MVSRSALLAIVVLLGVGVGTVVFLQAGTDQGAATNHTTTGNNTTVDVPSNCGILLSNPPPSVANEALVDLDHVFVFKERTTFLTQPLQLDVTTSGTVDSPSDLSTGTISNRSVHSYMLHYDSGTESFPRQFVNCTIGFEEDVIGVIVRGNSLDATDDRLGAPSTAYFQNNFRGLEFSQDAITVDQAANTVTVDWGVVSPYDHVRVLTEANVTPPDGNETVGPPANTTVLTEEAVTKDVRLAVSVSNLTVIRTPPQWTYLKESSCLIERSQAWSGNRRATMTVSVGNRSLVTCTGRSPTFASSSPGMHLPPGTEIELSTNDGGTFEVDIWLRIRANDSVLGG